MNPGGGSLGRVAGSCCGTGRADKTQGAWAHESVGAGGAPRTLEWVQAAEPCPAQQCWDYPGCTVGVVWCVPIAGPVGRRQRVLGSISALLTCPFAAAGVTTSPVTWTAPAPAAHWITSPLSGEQPQPGSCAETLPGQSRRVSWGGSQAHTPVPPV